MEWQRLVAVQIDTYEKLGKAQINFKKAPKDRITITYVDSRLETLQQYWTSFKHGHDQLVAAIPKANRGEISYFTEDIFDKFEELYHIYNGELKMVTQRLNPTKPRSETTKETATCKSSSEVKLPRISIPVFSGNYMEWQSFHDLFVALIHRNDSLENVQKLHYLKTNLSGEAEALLRQFAVTGDNYEEAWSIVNKRYSNKRFIANCIFKKLFSQKTIMQESAHALKQLLDTSVECLNSLKNLGLPVEHWDAIVIYIIVSKLDTDSHKQWEETISTDGSDEIPKLDKMKMFLETRFRTLEMIESSSKGGKPSKPKIFHTTVTPQCAYCKEQDHYIYNCKQFTKLPVENRYDFVQTNRLCFNCLIPNHTVLNCRQTSTCRICNKKHHSLLHAEKRRSENENSGEEDNNHRDQRENEQDIKTHFSKRDQPGQNVLLATALVNVPSGRGKSHVFRALIDQGSQASFVTESMVQSLGLKRIRINGVVTGIGEENNKLNTKYIVKFTLQSRYDTTFTIQVQAYVLNSLTTYLPSTEVLLDWPELNAIKLADPAFNTPSKVDVLLGADVFGKIINNGLMKGPSGIVAQNTHLGWILSGDISNNSPNKPLKVVSMHTHILDLDNEILKKFWELETESYTKTKFLTEDEEKCEEIYRNTVTRDDTGRYIVHLPLKEGLEETINRCGDTKQIATKRFLQLERKFNNNDILKEEYSKVMKEYLTLGHMERAEESKMAVYLPHHAVIREDKDTSKVRVVFDASAKGSNGYSLNDNMLIGPVLQPDLRTLLTRWRTHKICIVGDVVKMYRQIRVAPEYANLQRILWRDDPHEDLKSYKLLTVTFGTASAPYLAVKTLIQLAKDERELYSTAADIIQDSFYMDDLMSGAETIDEAKKIYEETNKILESGGFEMQKWSSNSDDLLRFIQMERGVSTDNLEIKIDKVIKILGLTWDRHEDIFKFKVNLPEDVAPVTKRSILSNVSRLFDPFGWLAPVLISSKILIQKLWLSGVGWDEDLPEELVEEWICFKDGLINLESVRLNRWLHINSTDNEKIEIHGFADASTEAYGAVAYLKVIDRDGKVHINLIAARTKVAPLKQVSIPRLELCAATLLTRLLKDLTSILKISMEDVYAWTDSMIVLAWLRSHPSKWQTFVANRVSEIIQTINNTNWRHVKSSDNPADLASRGIDASEFSDKEIWWNGPAWLKNKTIKINKHTIQDTEIEMKKERKKTNLNKNDDSIKGLHTKITDTNNEDHIEDMDTTQENKIWKRYSTLTKLKRVTAYCRRWYTRQHKEEESKHLTVDELNQALESCIKYYQQQKFSEEIRQLKTRKHVSKKSVLSTLAPFLDENGVLRVGGRLQKADLLYEEKHPYIIPSNTHLTWLIIQDAHLKTLHGGNQLTMSTLRSQFWIIRMRKEVKMHIQRCVICIRHRARTQQQMMGILPACRVNPGRAFENSGVDYAGPIQIRMSKGRGYKSTKGYICLFVCMSTRAVHIEAVSDMTTQAFLAAFRRFVARRGHCAHLWSDNGSNFVGAAKELKNLLQKGKNNISREIAEAISTYGTTWHFIPPKSPNFGGIWEAAIKSAKYHLTRIIGNNTLTYEEMATLLAQIESCLNSRPLCRISDVSEVLTPLTPGHFLIGGPLNSVPDTKHETLNINLLTRWQLVQRMTEHFWRRWKNEYLHTLQHRYKWRNSIQAPKIGDIVIIKEEDLPPTRWLLGKITEMFQGPDGRIRVVTVQCNKSTFTRPLSKLIILPIEALA